MGFCSLQPINNQNPLQSVTLGRPAWWEESLIIKRPSISYYWQCKQRKRTRPSEQTLLGPWYCSKLASWFINELLVSFVNINYSSPQELDHLWMSWYEIWGDNHNHHKNLIKHLGSYMLSYFIFYRRFCQREQMKMRRREWQTSSAWS